MLLLSSHLPETDKKDKINKTHWKYYWKFLNMISIFDLWGQVVEMTFSTSYSQDVVIWKISEPGPLFKNFRSESWIQRNLFKNCGAGAGKFTRAKIMEEINFIHLLESLGSHRVEAWEKFFVQKYLQLPIFSLTGWSKFRVILKIEFRYFFRHGTFLYRPKLGTIKKLI